MTAFVTTWIFSFGVYLLLTIGSGNALGLWAVPELLLGLVVASIVAVVAAPWFGREVRPGSLNPLRWLRCAGYVCGGFFLEMAKANVDVAIRVITGRIRPGIVKVESGMANDAGLVMLANSITLTPGTLTVEVDPDSRFLYVHMIHVPEGMESRDSIVAQELFGLFDCPNAIRRLVK